MPRFAKLLAIFVIAANLGTAWAGSLESDFQTFLTTLPSEQQRADIFRRLGELPEDQLDQFLSKAIPYKNLIRPEEAAQYIQFLSGLNAFGNENFVGYIFHALTQMKAGPHTLKPLLIYGLMKGGKAQVPRIENFLKDYRKSQGDADTLHAIDVMLEYLPAMKAQIATPVQVDINQRVQELNARLQTVWFQCPAKIWTPVSPTRPQALFKDSSSGRSWLVNENGIKEL